MKHIIRKYKNLAWRYATVQNATLLLALVVVFGWVWSTIETLQKNFYYQRRVDQLSVEVELEKLRNENLAFQQKYYRSEEYLELSARQRLGKSSPGEKLVILPDSRGIKDKAAARQETAHSNPSNFSQWMRFLFGEKRQQ